MDPHDPRARSHSQAHRHSRQTATQCLSRRGDPSQPPMLQWDSPPYLILKYLRLWLSDSVQLVSVIPAVPHQLQANVLIGIVALVVAPAVDRKPIARRALMIGPGEESSGAKSRGLLFRVGQRAGSSRNDDG